MIDSWCILHLLQLLLPDFPQQVPTAFPGATLVFTQTAASGTPTATTNYIQQTIILPNALAGTTVRLIFTWQNNASGSFQPPAAIDNVSLTYIPPIPPTVTSFTPSTACDGTSSSVTITGTNFTAPATVQFNGVSAPSTSIVNATTITAVLPASGVTTGFVSVTTPNGTATSAAILTINQPPAGLTYTLPTTIYCEGTAITDNTPSSGGGAVTSFSVSPALPTGLDLNLSTGIISGTPVTASAATDYVVSATNSCGSSTQTLNITVTSPPLSVAYGTNPAIYCQGTAITLNLPGFTGGAPTNYSVSPALPTGLSINTVTGVISGTPASATGAADYIVTASNECGVTTGLVNITISPAAPSALTYTLNAPSYCAGTAITDNTPSSGGGIPTSYSVSPILPAGLSLNTSTGVISGTPTSAIAAANYTVTAINSCGSAINDVNITVTTSPLIITYTTNPAVYCPGNAITANSPGFTGGAPASYSVSPVLPPGLSLNSATGVISGIPTSAAVAADYTITASNMCSSATVEVNITISPAAPSALAYTLNAPSYCAGTAITNNTPSSGGGTPTSYSVNPVLPAGLILDLVTGIISGTPTTATTATNYTVTASNSCGSATKVVNITVVAQPATVAYTVNPAVYCPGTVITANSPTITGGTPTSYSVSPVLPAGLSLNAVTGVISGIPSTTTAATNYIVTATNGCGSANVAVNITISPAAPTALNYTLTPATYCAGAAIINNSPSNTGGTPTLYSVSPALPAGLSLNTSTGVISGTPASASAAANYTVTATNSCGFTTKAVNITVAAQPATVTYSLNPAVYCPGTVITANSPTITGGAPTSYSVSPALPAGLNLNAATGVISGTPSTTTAAANYIVTATNGCGSATVAVNITISPAAPTALNYTITPVTYCAGAAIINNSPSNAGGIPTLYSVSPALPAGLSLNTSTGVISGTPASAIAAANYTVTASNSCGSTTKAVNIAVVAQPATVAYTLNPAVYCPGTVITANSPTITGGAPTSYSVSPALPAGLNLNAVTGVISGTPSTTTGAANYTVTATNGCGSATVAVNITISPAAPTALNYTLTPATYCAGAAIINNSPSNAGGIPTLYSVSPALPAGLSLNTSTGIISGTPTSASAAANYIVTASNSCGSTTKVLNITVNTPPSISIPPVSQTICAGQSVTFSVTAAGTSPAYQWRKNGVNIGGATGSSYTINPVTAGLPATMM